MKEENHELRGADALVFARRLKKLKANPDTWEIEYVDEDTGEKWLMDYPDSEYHGGGSPRLRNI